MFKQVAKTMAKAAVLVCAAGGLVGLAGCAGGPQTYAVFDTTATFNQYRTFAFVADVEPTDAAPYRSLSTKYLQMAIRQELTARGLQEAKDAQLLVAFGVATKEKVASVPSLRTETYRYVDAAGRLRAIAVGTDNQVQQYTEGTLNIDVIDASQKQVVWQGVAVGKQAPPKNNDLQPQLAATVAKIFARYPVAKVQ